MKTAASRESKQQPVGVSQRVSLKRAGGSLIMTVPSRARDALNLVEGQEVTVSVHGDRLVVEKAAPVRPTYTLDALLRECDFEAPYSDEERAWLDAQPVGRELL